MRRRASFQSLEQRIVLTSVTLELREIYLSNQHTLAGLSLADFDGDGNIDWLTTMTPNGTEPIDRSDLALFENDGNGHFEFSQWVNTEGNGDLAVSVFSVGDMDNDGDLDIVALSVNELSWHENDGSGAFERQIIVGSEDPSNWCDSVFNMPPEEFLQAIDMEGDGDLDIVVNVVSCTAGFENLGSGVFAARSEFALGVSGKSKGFDWEDDGDADFFSLAAGPDDDSRLLVNNDGEFTAEPLENDMATDWDLFDLDGDGTRELVSSSVWLDVLQESGIELPLQRADATRTMVGDIDRVGQQDVFVTQVVGGLGGLTVTAWVEDAIENPVLHRGPSARNLQAFSQTEVVDFDLDGDDDVITHFLACSPSGFVAQCLILIENHLTGDANDDNTVDFVDFLSLSSNFGKAADAVWEDGDFNLDGTVDFTDFLLLSAAFGETRS